MTDIAGGDEYKQEPQFLGENLWDGNEDDWVTDRDHVEDSWRWVCRKPNILERVWYALRGKDAEEEVCKRTWMEGRGASKEEDDAMAAALVDKIIYLQGDIFFYSDPIKAKLNLLTVKLAKKEELLTREYFKLTCGKVFSDKLEGRAKERVEILCSKAREKMEEANDGSLQELVAQVAKDEVPEYRLIPPSVKRQMLLEEKRWEDAVLFSEDYPVGPQSWWSRTWRWARVKVATAMTWAKSWWSQ